MGSKINEAQTALAACVTIIAGWLAGQPQAYSAAWVSSLAAVIGRILPPSALVLVPKGTLTPGAFAVLSVIPRPDTGIRGPPGNTSGKFEIFCSTRTRIPGRWLLNCWTTPGTTGRSRRASSGGLRRLSGRPGRREPGRPSGGFPGWGLSLRAGGGVHQ